MLQITRQEAEDFLYEEAAMLDERRFEEWLTLLAPDVRYWIPSGRDVAPHVETPIAYDDRGTLEDRVTRLGNRNFHAQAPASRTLHAVTNVRTAPAGDLVKVLSNLTVHETRGQGERSLAASCEHHLRRTDGRLEIVLKKVWLLGRDQAHNNLTFLI
ncbi:MAG: Ring hydroxylating dioxygenase subunit beta [Ramlibacter sp.]|jgi:3-phenylpropionate/cinnamic acid dioxygenase small subunit|uniref:aromatic-ring-hydroxylating dioxygenase subunit beta n=1 Tax=Ramlibacter sp. TaxID=1917967 RepID=UPI0026297250|nr:aromatic-ring-hydroxylating dioxygenase subunit beta [Ramlibacter sp.]MDB5749902.1 Ring hydroxylating dioxygenase subunit beta [Ramlibacter sp.]